MTGKKGEPDVSKRAVAVEFWLSGLSYAEIGQRLGVSRQRAQQLVRPPRAIFNAIRQRANGKCEDCGLELASGHIHHRRARATVESYNDLDNLAYLCVSCHRQRHHGNIRHCQQCDLWFTIGRQSEPKECPRCKRYDWNEPKKGESSAAD